MAILPVISDPYTFLVSITGILLSIVYVLTKLCSSEERRVDEGFRNDLVTWLNGVDAREPVRLDTVLRDYEFSNEEIGRRDNIILLVGTILIGSSLVIIGSIAAREPSYPIALYAFGSIGFYCVWLWGIHETAVKLNHITYSRLKAIEEAVTIHLDQGNQSGAVLYSFGIHSYIHRETANQTACWLRTRRVFWGLVLLFLSFVWMLFSISLKYV